MFGLNSLFETDQVRHLLAKPGADSPSLNIRGPHPEDEVVVKNDSGEWQFECWRKWPKPENWPAILDVYEAAAFLRVSHWTLRRATVTGRDGRAKLSHQRIGSVIRFRRSDLEKFGLVKDRAG